MSDSLSRTLESIREFTRERDWARFHTNKNLAIALAVEAAEVLEHFQWEIEENAELSREEQAALQQELADVAIYLLHLADNLHVDLLDAIRSKLAVNRSRFPASGGPRSSRSGEDHPKSGA